METSNTTPDANEQIVPPVSSSIAKQKQASWGALIIIALILAMVVVGAFYAWGKRIARTQPVPATTTATY